MIAFPVDPPHDPEILQAGRFANPSVHWKVFGDNPEFIVCTQLATARYFDCSYLGKFDNFIRPHLQICYKSAAGYSPLFCNRATTWDIANNYDHTVVHSNCYVTDLAKVGKRQRLPVIFNRIVFAYWTKYIRFVRIK
jgi:hypothetical protein